MPNDDYYYNENTTLVNSDAQYGASQPKRRTFRSYYNFNALLRTKTLEDLKAEEAEEAGEGGESKTLKKCLNAFDLVAYGLGSTVGTGLFVTAGQVAHQDSGPSIILSFAIAGFASLLSAFCYSEFAARIPASGSAFTFSYACLGELVAMFIGWNLTLEYSIGASAVARGWSGYFIHIFKDFNVTVPTWVYGYNWWKFSFSPLSAAIIILCTIILLFGVKNSARVNMIITIVNIGLITFITIYGAFFVNKDNWKPFFPYGGAGAFRGASTVFFSYIGFDSVTTLAEEVAKPQRDLPIGIIGTLGIATGMYVAVSLVLTGMVKYSLLDPNAALSSAFAYHGVGWAAKLVDIGICTTVTATVLCSLMGQPRIFYRMAKDGLLFRFMSKLNKHNVPVASTIISGVAAATLSLFFGLDSLTNMISIGTLLAFNVVCGGVVILRYKTQAHGARRIVPLVLFFFVLCVIFSAIMIYVPHIPWWAAFPLALPLVACSVFIFFQKQAEDVAALKVKCPLVPFVPCAGMLINTYMIVQLPWDAFVRVIVWTSLGLAIYFGYGIRNSSLVRREDQTLPVSVNSSEHEDNKEQQRLYPPVYSNATPTTASSVVGDAAFEHKKFDAKPDQATSYYQNNNY